MDERVRGKHAALEGRVFKHLEDRLHPGDDYGCRCYRENLPIHAEIMESEETTKPNENIGLDKDIEIDKQKYRILKNHHPDNPDDVIYILPTAPAKILSK